MTKQQQKQLGIVGVTAGGLLFFFRHHMHQGTSTPKYSGAATSPRTPSVTNGGAFGQLAPYTPQEPLTVQAGESVYDPNTGNLLQSGPPHVPPSETVYNPDGTGTLLTAPPTAPAQATVAGAPSYVVKVNYPQHHRARKPNRHPRRTKHKRGPA